MLSLPCSVEALIAASMKAVQLLIFLFLPDLTDPEVSLELNLETAKSNRMKKMPKAVLQLLDFVSMCH